MSGNIEHGDNIQSATISAKIIHPDGTVEDLGIIASSEPTEDQAEEPEKEEE